MKGKFMTLMSFLGLSLVTVHAATQRAPECKLTAKSVANHLEVVATPPARHHFNLKAPMSLTEDGLSHGVSPAEAKENEIRFNIPNAKKSLHFSVSVYLCDDAKTFCERHVIDAHWNGNASEFQFKSGNARKPAHSEVLVPHKSQELGFIVNDPRKALAEAKEKRLPLMIDFFGIWCPPCNQFDEEVFPSEEFQNESSHFIKLKLDADSEISWELKSRYKIGGYPTIIFASADGIEVSRVVGFRELPVFLKLMKEAWGLRDRPMTTLVADAKNGNRDALDRLGSLHLERREYNEAMQYLKESKAFREKYYEAQIGALEDKSDNKRDTKGAIALLEASIQEFPRTPDSINRRLKLADLYAESKETEKQRRNLNEALGVAKEWLGKPSKLRDFDLSPPELWATIAEVQETLKNSSRAHEAWNHAVAEYRKKIKTGHERGYHLELAYCLWKGGDIDSAEKIYKTFETLYPHEFTFFFSHASMKMAQKKFADAELLARKAFEFSYGDNKIRVAHTLAKAIQSQGRSAEAREFVQKVIQESGLPEDSTIRTHRYMKQLQKLYKELQPS